MNCKDFQETIVELFDVNIAPAVKAKCEQHIKECPECSKYYDELQAVFEQLQPKAMLDASQVKTATTHAPKEVVRRQKKIWWAVAASVIFLIGVFVGFNNFFTTSATATSQSPIALFDKAITYVQNVGSFQMEVFARTRPQENFYSLSANEDFVRADLQLIRENDSVFYRVERVGERGRVVMCNGAEQYMWTDIDAAVKAPLDYNLLGIYGNLFYPDRLLSMQKSAIEMNKVDKVSQTETDSTILVVVDGTEWNQDMQQLYEKGHKGKLRVTIENTFSKTDGLLRSVKYWVQKDGKKILALYTGAIQYNPMLSKKAVIAMPPMKEDKIMDIEDAPEVKQDRLSQLQRETSVEAAKRIMAALSSGKIENIVEAFSGSEDDLPDLVEVFRGCKFSDFTKRTSEDYAGEYVYFQIEYPDGTKKLCHLALRSDNEARIWVFDGGL